MLNECVLLHQLGRDWKWGDQDGGEGQIGTVYRLKTLTEIYVSTEGFTRNIFQRNSIISIYKSS